MQGPRHDLLTELTKTGLTELPSRCADHHRAVTALRESERRFRALIEHSTEIIVIAGADGRLRYASPSAMRMLGSDQAADRDIFKWIHPEDVDQARQALADALAGEPRDAIEIRFMADGGAWRLLEVRLRDHTDDPGIEGIVLTAHDVTERRELEHQFRQAQKMEAVGRLAGGVAHDLNNVLTVVTGFTQLVRESVPGSSDAQGDLDQITRAAERGAKLIGQLLAFSRQQVSRPAVMDLNEVVSGMERMLGPLIGADVELRTQLEPRAGRVQADRVQLEQVLVNLAVNAKDAMPNGGQLLLETGNAELDDDFARGFPYPVQPGRYVLLTVSDTGIGMPAAVRERVFEPFFTTKGPAEGTGLGLSTVYGIVKQAGGYIWVESAPGAGSTFRIYLPRVSAATTPSEAPGAGAPARPGGGKTILLVEDDASVRSYVRRILQRESFTVLESAAGESALELVDEYAGAVDLLITDVVLPGMNGHQLATRLTGLRPAVRVLYISGHPRSEVAHWGILEPGITLIEKPFTPETLCDSVRQVVEAV